MNGLELFAIRVGHYYDVFQLKKIIRLFLCLVILWIAGSIYIYLTESLYFDIFSSPGADPELRFASYGDCMWGILVYLFSGFESYIPKTNAGRTGAVVFMVFGVGIIGLFTANIASILIEKSERKGAVRRKPETIGFKDHLVIFGWSPSAGRILQTLYDSGLYRGIPAVIIDERDIIFPPSDLKWGNIYHVSGPYNKRETLERADIRYSRQVLVMESESADRANSRALTACYAIKNISENSKITVFIKSKDKIELIRRYADEVISLPDIQAMAVSQSVITRGAMKTLSVLLEASRSSPGIRLSEIGRDMMGMHYSLAKSYGYTENNSIILGLFETEKKRYIINPADDPVLSEKYRLIIL